MKKITFSHKVSVAALLCLAALLYYFINPAHTAWMPKCMFYQLTHLECPACGAQRALYSLLHLQIGQAIGYNPFLVISVPYFLAVAYTTFRQSHTALKLKPLIHHRYVIRIYLVLVILWWIIRNIK